MFLMKCPSLLQHKGPGKTHQDAEGFSSPPPLPASLESELGGGGEGEGRGKYTDGGLWGGDMDERWGDMGWGVQDKWDRFRKPVVS